MTISLIVNTCDAFEDCWDPFFILFKKYWPNFEGIIYLNTENKDYSYNNLNIIPLKVASKKNMKPFELSWSECLIDALNNINDEIILYMQEDYFLKDFVNTEDLEKYYNFIKNNNEVDCIHLTDQGTHPDQNSEKKLNLYLANKKSKDLLSCQAAFWRKSALLKCLKTSESGWQFEQYGSKRAKYLDLNIYVPDRKYIKKNQYEIIPYVFTGIVQGKWIEEVPKLFERNNIQFDFSKRGFIKERSKSSLSKKIRNKFKHILLSIVCFKDVLFIKLKKN